MIRLKACAIMLFIIMFAQANGNFLSGIWSAVKYIIKNIIWIETECETDERVCENGDRISRDAGIHCNFPACATQNLSIERRAVSASELFMNAEFVVPYLRYEDVRRGKLMSLRILETRFRKKRMANEWMRKCNWMELYTWVPSVKSAEPKDIVLYNRLSLYALLSQTVSRKLYGPETVKLLMRLIMELEDEERGRTHMWKEFLSMNMSISSVQVIELEDLSLTSLHAWWMRQNKSTQSQVTRALQRTSVGQHEAVCVYVTPLSKLLVHAASSQSFLSDSDMISKLKIAMWKAIPSRQCPSQAKACAEKDSGSRGRFLACDTCSCWKVTKMDADARENSDFLLLRSCADTTLEF